MYKGLFLLTSFFIITTAKAQFSDNFNDGDFTANPAWAGLSTDFTVNASGQLQSANTIASSTFTITTPSATAQKAEWEFWTKLDFNPSSVNYADVWLTSQLQDLNNASNSGYFVRLGSTDDDICLYQKTSGSAPQKIIDGVNGLLNTSSNSIKIKVVCTVSGKWILLRDMSGTGTAYRSEGEITDNSVTTSNYFGISIKQSTASFFNKHFFDDIVAKSFEEVSGTPPVISVTAPSAHAVKLVFERPVNISTAEDVTHYFISGIGNPISATVDPINGTVVILNFAGSFTPNEKNTILLNGIADVYGNQIINTLKDFYYYQAVRYDVVIDEIFADTSPQVGLPAQKFIELKNTAPFPVNVKNWRLSDENNTAYLPDVEIQPGSFLIITTSSGYDAYKVFGNTISVSNFPSLYVSGGEVALYNESGMLMHAMNYDPDSYGNELKKEGGYTLEMINTKAGCVINGNWIASNDPSGGTPGRKNSVDANKAFEENIKVLNAYLSSPDTLYVMINKTVDSTSAAKKENYILDGGLVASSIDVLPPFFSTIRIALTTSAAEHNIYTVKVNSLSGCDGSSINNTKNVASFAIPEEPTTGDLVINELLFDPMPNGVDYIELYNNSQKAIDLKKIFVANRNASGAPANFVQVSNQSKLLLPGKFALLTIDPAATASQYPAADTDAFITMNALPSFADDSGTAIIMSQQANIIDEINYSKYWHFSLIKDRQGISLERISYSAPSNQSNFHSASTTVKGTPGYKNSQSATAVDNDGAFKLSPEVFSPDNDGTDDFLTINYEFPSPGYVTNIKIFDASGKMVRYLEKNSLSGVKGYYRWDGLDDKNGKLPQGIYIIYFESFNDQGKKVIHKKTVVLARRW